MKKILLSSVLLLSVLSLPPVLATEPVPANVAVLSTATANPLSEFEFSNGTITKYVGNAVDVVIPSYYNGEKVTTIGTRAFDYNKTTSKEMRSIYVPDTVTIIEDYAFYGSGMTSIRLPENLQTLGSRSLANSGLTSITLPNTLKEIPESCFSYCIDLESVDFGTGVTTIGDCAFQFCYSLKSVRIPSTIKTIQNAAFYISGLETVIIEEGVTELPTFCFANAYDLTEVYLPSSLKKIGTYVFYKDEALQNIYYAGTQANRNALEIVTTEDGKIGEMECNEELLSTTWTYNTPAPALPSSSTTTTTTPTTTTTTSKTATPSTAKVTVNGETVSFGAYNIDGYNYFKLTDISYAISGSGQQFNVQWDSTKNAINMLFGQGHTVLGTELQPNSGVNETADLFTSPIYCNGVAVAPEAYIINGSSYFQLNALTELIGFSVAWNGTTSTIQITTN